MKLLLHRHKLPRWKYSITKQLTFHGRIPHNMLDYKLGYNPNPNYQLQTDVAEEEQKRTTLRLDKTKKIIMQSYLNYKVYYDRKAKTFPLESTDYDYILNPKAKTQATKMPIPEFGWGVLMKLKKSFLIISI